MSRLEDLAAALEDARLEYEQVESGSFKELERYENYTYVKGESELTMDMESHALPEGADAASVDGTVYCGDNLALLKYMAEGEYKGRIGMVYIDPPFFTEKKQSGSQVTSMGVVRTNEYEDSWDSFRDYMRELAARLIGIREVLSDKGLVFIHLDWHAVHDVRVLADEIFGEKNFVNEIIWTYKSGGSSKRRFSRKHDNIIVYSKTEGYDFFPLMEKSYNRGLKPYHFKGVKEYQDETGWYTNVRMKDVWDLNMVGRTSGERTGYATQKPLKLIERMVECSTKPGDICADFYCGSGTLAVAAAYLGRKFAVCDANPVAAGITADRIAAENKRFSLAASSYTANSALGVFPPGSAVIPGTDLFIRTEKISEGCAVVRFIEEKGRDEGSQLDYVTDMDRLDKGSRDVFLSCVENDPFELIKSWSAGKLDENGVFSPEEIFSRNGKKLSREGIVDIPPDFREGSEDQRKDVAEAGVASPVVKVTDILGRDFYIEM